MFAPGHRARAPRTGRLLHLASVLVCVLLVAGQIVATLHFALVPHRLCALHGIEDVRGGHEVDPLALGQRADYGAVRAPASVEDSHGDCLLASLLHDRVALVPPSRATGYDLPPAQPTFITRADEAPRSLGTLVVLAPKQGPPV